MFSCFVIAYKYDEKLFRGQILSFIRGDSKKIKYLLASNDWAKFNVEDRELATKILDDIYS